MGRETDVPEYVWVKKIRNSHGQVSTKYYI